MTTAHLTTIDIPAATGEAEPAGTLTTPSTADVFANALSALDAAGIGFEIIEETRFGRAA
jgi:hypothetical protein